MVILFQPQSNMATDENVTIEVAAVVVVIHTLLEEIFELGKWHALLLVTKKRIASIHSTITSVLRVER